MSARGRKYALAVADDDGGLHPAKSVYSSQGLRAARWSFAACGKLAPMFYISSRRFCCPINEKTEAIFDLTYPTEN
jgi:hypothetical protein